VYFVGRLTPNLSMITCNYDYDLFYDRVVRELGFVWVAARRKEAGGRNTPYIGFIAAPPDRSLMVVDRSGARLSTSRDSRNRLS
jgi:hypothetical protein